ncbi:MAG: LysM peptidoglycan-binding domain-containing protein [Planctomycetota bacterium]|nr:LysM peptidoglycan-binding domain-containing protein [Planctomycetota bacterium]MDA1114444.1 LysM peptidoglycan-binding domain-containing protein [Planctomycetota bacterium]
MNRVQRTALLAFFLLLLMAAAGWWLGGKQAQPADAKPAAVLLDPGGLEAVRFLPPAQRKHYLNSDRFRAQAVDNPLDPRGGRVAGGSLPENETGNSAGISGSIPVNASYRTIRVHQNETLSLIAKRELGKSSAWRDLLRWNNIKDERSIKVGQQLRIYDDLYDPSAQLETVDQPKKEELVAVEGMRYHTVKSGEILGRISQQYYQTSREVPRILEANGFTDAHSIKAGQVLKIPPIN